MSSVKSKKTNVKKLQLSSINKVDDSVGNKFQANLNTNLEINDNFSIGLEKCIINKQWNNIEASRNNHKCSILWNADTTVQYDLTLPDGGYTVGNLLYRLQNFMASNDLYCVNSVNGDIVYFIDIEIDDVAYGISVTFMPLPTSVQATALNYTKAPDATWNFPVTASTPQLIIPTGFGKLMGYIANTYPETPEISTHVFTGGVPQFNPVGNVNITCNFVSNGLGKPSNFFDSFSTDGERSAPIGINNSNPAMLTCNQNTYTYLLLEFFDQYYKPLFIKDNDVAISILLKHEY